MIRPAFDGGLDHPADVGLPLRLVGVEQRLGRASAADALELPGEVGDVADAGAHALAEERRHLVRAVAGDEHPAPAPIPRHERVERVDGGADDVDVLGGDPGREQLARRVRRLEVVEVLARQRHDLPAPVRRRRGGRTSRAGGDRSTARRPSGARPAGAGACRPRARAGRSRSRPAWSRSSVRVTERAPSVPTTYAARTVRPSPVARSRTVTATWSPASLDRLHLVAEPERHVVEPVDPGTQRPLELGLGEHVVGVRQPDGPTRAARRSRTAGRPPRRRSPCRRSGR